MTDTVEINRTTLRVLLSEARSTVESINDPEWHDSPYGNKVAAAISDAETVLRADRSNNDASDLSQYEEYADGDVFSDELTDCPACGGSLVAADVFESDGNGNGWLPIECSDCEWRAREDWVIEETVTLE